MDKRPSGPPPSSHGFKPESMESSLKAESDFGQYRIVKLLGVGGMGEVYEVEHRVLETRHALKLINESIMANKIALSYFKTEGRVMAQLHHPGIVVVDEFGETDGRFWLRMELMDGVEATGGSLITLEDYVWYMGGNSRKTRFSNACGSSFLPSALRTVEESSTVTSSRPISC